MKGGPGPRGNIRIGIPITICRIVTIRSRDPGRRRAIIILIVPIFRTFRDFISLPTFPILIFKII